MLRFCKTFSYKPWTVHPWFCQNTFTSIYLHLHFLYFSHYFGIIYLLHHFFYIIVLPVTLLFYTALIYFYTLHNYLIYNFCKLTLKKNNFQPTLQKVEVLKMIVVFVCKVITPPIMNCIKSSDILTTAAPRQFNLVTLFI